jgi:hypothetical protein
MTSLSTYNDVYPTTSCFNKISVIHFSTVFDFETEV